MPVARPEIPRSTENSSSTEDVLLWCLLQKTLTLGRQKIPGFLTACRNFRGLYISPCQPEQPEYKRRMVFKFHARTFRAPALLGPMAKRNRVTPNLGELRDFSLVCVVATFLRHLGQFSDLSIPVPSGMALVHTVGNAVSVESLEGLHQSTG